MTDQLNFPEQRYRRVDCAVFLKTAERYGGLSNMAGGYPLEVNGHRILTSEALYQACRFPHLPDVQRLIIDQKSPMAAKMKSKPYRSQSRQDWNDINVTVMRWCLHVKLAQHWDRFGDLLRSTDDQPIVEESRRDPFWGARPMDDETLVGRNVLGILLTRLREELESPDCEILRTVPALLVPDFLLFGEPIGTVVGTSSVPAPQRADATIQQPALFDTSGG